jgi:predicted dehydrogenase
MVERTCPDHLLIHGSHASGCVSSVEILGGENAPLRFELRGTKGKLAIEGHHPGGYQCGGLTVTISPEAESQPETSLPGLTGQAINVGELWRRFESDIRTGQRTVPDFAVAVSLHALLDTIDRSSDLGQTMKTG